MIFNRLTGISLFFILLFFGCTEKKISIVAHPRPISFTTFEISFKGGWIGSFSLLVDSNKVFFSNPQFGGSIIYGIMPDSFFKRIDSLCYQLIRDTSIKSTPKMDCCDISQVAIKLVSKDDTLRIYQASQFDNRLSVAIGFIEEFLDKNKRWRVQLLGSYLELETSELVAPPPSPPMPPKQFLK